jgi:hypothetical protein
MDLCTDKELAAALAKLRAAFKDDPLSLGCRLEMALNVMVTALVQCSPPTRDWLVRHLVRQMAFGLLPQPTAPTSDMVH